ncbi:FUSC family protein [Succinimonas amylolytica]|uniref:FUSC family protein n=1 Tax=Succinimonas amylolytica TaxID=83769 RepID=UPI000362AFEA|nr:FUSC family protein [Succinimonas amylolytica]
MTDSIRPDTVKRIRKKRDSLLLRQMLSMGLSMLTAEIVSMLYPVDQSFWIALTTFCVCLYISTPLTALRRTAHRILGSIYGVIIAGIACLCFPETAGLLTFLVLFSGLTLWSRAFMSLYWLFVSFMTASVIMLLALLMRHTSLTPDYLITERVAFTILGAAISLIISSLVMPATERLDMLRTYRHYLTMFYLEYRICVFRLTETGRNDSGINPRDIFKSSRTYQEKLPVWRYALLFNVFIYRSFVRFLHRIHKMRLMNRVLLTSISTLPPEALPDPETKELLSHNRTETKKVILSLIRLNRDAASSHLARLAEINSLLEKRLLGQKGVSATIMLTLRELESDLSHLAGGAVQMYLTYKNGSRD